MSVEISQQVGNALDPDSPCLALPRVFRWVLGFKHSAVWLGAVVAAGYVLVAAAEFGRAGLPAGASWAAIVGDGLTYTVYYACIPVFISILVRGLERDVRDLTPVLSAKDGEAPLLREAFSVAPLASWLGAAAGLVMTLAVLWLTLAVDPSRRAGTLFLTLREIIVEVALFAPLGWVVGAAVRLSRLTEERACPDLIDPRPFAPLVRHGTRLAAVWLVIQAIGMPFIVAAPEGVDQELLRSAALLLVGMSCFAAILLILPSRGAHRVLRSAKQTELETVRSQIGEARRLGEDARLPGLLAWEARIEGLSEWPIDAPAIGRTGLFVLIPVASWIGSALVARFVDATMG